MGTGISAEPHWTEHPDVLKMIGVAVDKQLRLNPGLLRRHHDIDRESIIQDLWGVCVIAKFNPAKSAPGTFAHNVAFMRFRDILRARNIRIESDRTKNGGVERQTEIEGTIEDTVVRIYEAAKKMFLDCEIPHRVAHCGLPYMDRAQRMTLYVLQQRMQWSCREAEKQLREHPGIHLAIGVSYPPDHCFFARAKKSVAEIRKKIAKEKHSPE